MLLIVIELRRGVREVDVHLRFLRRQTLYAARSSLRPQHVRIDHYYLLVGTLPKVLLIEELLPLVNNDSSLVQDALEASQLLVAVDLPGSPGEPERHREHLKLGEADRIDQGDHGVE